ARGVEQGLPHEDDPASGLSTQAGQRLQERGLARPRGAHDRGHAPAEAGGHAQRELGERHLEVDLDHARVRRVRRRVIHSVVQRAAKARATVTPARTSARSSRPTWLSWKIARARVWVRPGMLPAIMTVAP